jgi:hypothetical protein
LSLGQWSYRPRSGSGRVGFAGLIMLPVVSGSIDPSVSMDISSSPIRFSDGIGLVITTHIRQVEANGEATACSENLGIKELKENHHQQEYIP